MVQISRPIGSIINSIFSLFSVSEWVFHFKTDQRHSRPVWDKAPAGTLGAERRHLHHKEGEREPEGWHQRRERGGTWQGVTQHWSPLVTTGQLEPEGLRGVVSGHQGTCQAGQCWSMVTRAQGRGGGTQWSGHGQHMSGWPVWHETPGRGDRAPDWSVSPVSLVSPPLPLDNRFHKFAETREKLWQNLVRPAWPGHTRRRSETKQQSRDGVCWCVLIWGSSLIVLFLASQLHQYQIS